MKYFWRTFIIGFFLVVMINIFIDKDYRFFRQPLAEKRNLVAGECLVLGNLESDRRAKEVIRQYIPKMDVLFLGSSRVSYVDREMIKPEYSFYNVNFSIGLLEDYIAVWQELKTTGRTPKNMIIFLDHWAFNKKNRFRAWESIPQLKKYLNDQGVETPLLKKPWRRYTELQYKRILENVSNLISFDYFKDSLIKIYERGVKGEPYVSCENLPRSKAFLVEDGHAIYPFLKPTKEELLWDANNMDGALQYADPWEINEELIGYFKLFLSDALKQGVSVTLISPLWHPISFQKLSHLERGKRITKDFFDIIKNLSKDTGVQSCLETDVSKVGCIESEFADAIHMERVCSLKLLKYCSQTNEKLRIILK